MMTRDDFEEWLEEHSDEALAHIEGDRFPLKSWIVLFGKALRRMMEEEASGESEEDDDEGVELDLFDD